MKIYNRQRELFEEAKKLRKLDLEKTNFETAKQIREKEQQLYNQWLFYKNLRKEVKRVNNNE